MLHATLRTLVKIAVTSLVVGTILAHFGITANQVMRDLGLSVERVEDYARGGFAWAWLNVLLGAIFIVPTWFLVYLLHAPGGQGSRE